MLQEILDKYLEIFPDERDQLKLLQQQIKDGEALNNRKNFRGHIAGDGIVLSPDRTKLLIVHHNTFNGWIQPGGHWDPEDSDPLAAAKREVKEETSLEKFELIKWQPGLYHVPIDICVDDIPANGAKHEPQHIHYTFAYVFQAASMELQAQLEEVSSAKWVSFEEAKRLVSGDARSHFPRIIKKLRRFNVI